MRVVVLFVFVFSALGFGSGRPSVAQEMPRGVAEAVRAMGPVINAVDTAKLFAPLHKKEPYQGVVVERDETYGGSARNRLDVFAAAGKKPPAPVLIYVHGGGYVRGDKRLGKDSPFHDNVMLWAVDNGMVGVNMTYRLAPDWSWPSGAEDVGLAVAWVRTNISKHGGDPTRIFLMGHSAGATHVAGYITIPQLQKSDGVGIAGAILVSGTYDLKADVDVPGQKAYFGSDTKVWEARSPAKGVAHSKVPLLLAHGEIDVPYYIEQAHVLRDALCAFNRCPVVVALKGHSHMSEIYALNTSDTALAMPILEFIAALK